ncbi:MAG: hypothetical protein A3D31_17475 [Candidatus Fluviicola riflensis]|nr:MAG: hypothetical protein CHH17_02415 [Candidatus Fluviicola riflensis]OGS76775.1 MAG: hypothetical protein A3D31_17475 [Candidatus Fluviicola riflensis]OGS82870.1 MAG: hypothetical protein A2724_13885 [Fluviicola sp. RIFCSPHIGHO2_01_FULL_43_53]OGS88505.1 MAG: hypothetical protein A3E30_06980 [Fluviicola sp. RIFCSPHIGHO2_12_FULL_43_24]
MSAKRFPFDKLNFMLSVIGFIGSLGFYYGVLRKVYADEPVVDQQRIEQLQNDNHRLREQLEQAQKKQ